MEQEKKLCQNCKHEFTIEPDDFEFYEKIKVPAPTFCPDCRMQRRFAWRNERFLYHRPDYKTGKMLFSAFPPDAPIKTIAQEDWSSDDWDPMTYGREYDFARPFFEQLRELMLDVPFPARWVVNAHNADYVMNSNDIKDCYLVMSSSFVQNSSYCVWVANVKDSLDLYNVAKSSLCYDSTFLRECSQVFFSTRCENSHNLFFCKDCVGCTDCFGSVNLRNKSYYIFNEQYTKDEYKKKIESFCLGSYSRHEELKRQARQFWLQFPNKYVSGRQNSHTVGEYIDHSKNVTDSYNVQGGENLRFCQNMLSAPSKDSYDYSNWGEGTEQIYETLFCGMNSSLCRFCVWCWSNDVDLQYSINCRMSSFLFGCSGIINGQYCILNKQYTKEEYKKLVPKIIEHMNSMPFKDKKGNIYKYGEFLPIEFSLLPYNETISQEFFPLQRDEAKENGYFWRDDNTREYNITIPAHALSDRIQDVSDSITNEVIGCAHEGICGDGCTKGFKIIKQELEFYRRFNIPLPRLCLPCRHVQRLKDRNDHRLWHRKCMKPGCQNEFETSYAPVRPEIVYCESCYNAEVA